MSFRSIGEIAAEMVKEAVNGGHICLKNQGNCAHNGAAEASVDALKPRPIATLSVKGPAS